MTKRVNEVLQAQKRQQWVDRTILKRFGNRRAMVSVMYASVTNYFYEEVL